MNEVLRQLIRDVVDSADDDGCSDDLTVASKSAIAGLAAYLAGVDAGNQSDSNRGSDRRF